MATATAIACSTGERAHGLSPRVNDANRDRDRDGLTNLAEYRSGTNPRKADSDRVGVRDDREAADRDGLSNLAEYRFGTDPRKADSHRDGVRDDREDADHDGVSNGREHYDDHGEGHSDDS